MKRTDIGWLAKFILPSIRDTIARLS